MTRYEAEDATISGSTREYIDPAQWGFVDESDMVSDAQPEAAKTVVLDDGGVAFFVAWTADGGDSITESDDAVEKKVGTNSYKAIMDLTANSGSWYHDYGGSTQDWSVYDNIGFWFYGANTGNTIWIYVRNGGWGVIGSRVEFDDDFTGWKWISRDITGTWGGGRNAVRGFEFFFDTSEKPWSETYRVDGIVVYNGLHSSPALCDVIINDRTNNTVGDYCTTIESNAGGWMFSKLTPVAPTANLLKFDELKMYLHKNSDYSQVLIYLVDGDGDSIYSPVLSIDQTPTEYTLDVPHSDADLVTYGWNDGGDTFDYSNFAYMWIASISLASGLIIYVDEVRFCQTAVTERGRGEALSDDEAAVLQAQAEYVEVDLIAGTSIEEGFYEARVIAKSTDEVTSDLEVDVEGMSGFYSPDTALADDYTRVFEVTAADVSGGATITIKAVKALDDENTMFVDYFEVVRHGSVHEPYGFDSMQEQLFEYDDFLGAVLDDRWLSTGDAGGSAVVIDAETGGIVRITTDGDDNDEWFVTWNTVRGMLLTKNVAIEARLKVATITSVTALLRLWSSGTLRMAIGIDTDSNGTNYIIFSQDAVDYEIQDSGIAFDTDEHILRIECHTHGGNHIHFFIDGVETDNSPLSTYIPDGATDYLEAQFLVQTRTTSARTMDVDYVGVRQDR
jgi:hypothetical protein